MQKNLRKNRKYVQKNKGFYAANSLEHHTN